MLPRIDYLKKKEDIEKVLKKGEKFKEDFLICKIISNTLGRTRFGFIVSRRVSKKATLRNKIKRRLKEIVRKKIKLKKGVDGILIACPGLEEKDFWEIDESLNKLFKKAKCLKS